MYVVVGEGAAVRVHGGGAVDDAVGDAAVGALGGVLLGHPLVHVDGGVADFQQAGVLGVGVCVGVDHGVGGGAWGEEVRHGNHLHPKHQRQYLSANLANLLLLIIVKCH